MSARGARRPRRRRGEGEDILPDLMHRLLHHGRNGVWTWRVRGAKVPAVQKNDVRLEIDPAADSHYCPDCRIGSILVLDTIVKMPDSSPEVARLVETAARDLQECFGAAIERGQAAGEIAAGVDPVAAGAALLGLYLGRYVLIHSGACQGIGAGSGTRAGLSPPRHAAVIVTPPPWFAFAHWGSGRPGGGGDHRGLPVCRES